MFTLDRLVPSTRTETENLSYLPHHRPLQDFEHLADKIRILEMLGTHANEYPWSLVHDRAYVDESIQYPGMFAMISHWVAAIRRKRFLGTRQVQAYYLPDTGQYNLTAPTPEPHVAAYVHSVIDYLRPQNIIDRHFLPEGILIPRHGYVGQRTTAQTLGVLAELGYGHIVVPQCDYSSTFTEVFPNACITEDPCPVRAKEHQDAESDRIDHVKFFTDSREILRQICHPSYEPAPDILDMDRFSFYALVKAVFFADPDTKEPNPAVLELRPELLDQCNGSAFGQEVTLSETAREVLGIPPSITLYSYGDWGCNFSPSTTDGLPVVGGSLLARISPPVHIRGSTENLLFPSAIKP